MITKAVSFTSNKPFKPNLVQRTLSRIGSVIPDKINDFCDLSSTGSMKRMPFLALAGVCVLGARYFQARNEDEKREVFTRDSVAVVTTVYGVPLLKKLAGMFINKKTGIPVAHGDHSFRKNLNPENGVQLASYEQLAEWLSVKNTDAFNGIKNNFAGFCENIRNLGGDVLKCFNVLDKNSKNVINGLAESLGYTKEINNKNIVGLIKKAEKATDPKIKQQLEPLKKMFVGENELLTKASHYKSATEFSCIAATAFLLGGLLPWFNINHTKNLYKKRKSENNSLNNEPNKTAPINNLSIMKKFETFQKTGQLV